MQADGFVIAKCSATQERNKFEMLSLNLKSAYLNLISFVMSRRHCRPRARSYRNAAGRIKARNTTQNVKQEKPAKQQTLRV